MNTAPCPVDTLLPGTLEARRQLWDSLDRTWRSAITAVAHASDCGGWAAPGSVQDIGGVRVCLPNGGYDIVAAAPYDHLMRLYDRRILKGRPPCVLVALGAWIRNGRICDPHFLPPFLKALIETLKKGWLGSGAGFVAPCFDSSDRDAEYGRGRWHIIDSEAFSLFRKTVYRLTHFGDEF